MNDLLDATHQLMLFGLTHQEAKLYTTLIGRNPATGYEIAKLSGISRPNVYSGLASLVEKGAALVVDGRPARYQAVGVREFSNNLIRRLGESAKTLEQRLSPVVADENAYLTIRGRQNVADKMQNLIEGSRKRLYVAVAGGLLGEFLPALREAVRRACKVVVVSDNAPELKHAAIHLAPRTIKNLRLVADSTHCLCGDLSPHPDCACLFSSRRTLAETIKESIKNEILLIENNVRY